VITHECKSGLEDIRQLKNIASEIKALKPDCIIDLHNTLRAKLIRFFCSTIPAVKVYKRTLLRNILILFKIDFLKKLTTHHERVINDFKFLFCAGYDRIELEEFISDQTNSLEGTLTTIPLSFEENILKTIKENYIVISPVASFEPKRWPIENFVALTKKVLNNKSYDAYKIVIVGGPSDSYCEKFNDLNGFDGRLINLQGKTSLDETNEILAHARLVITNDTGVGHMAEALAVDVVSIFGPTSPSFGFPPQIVYANVACSPCSATGKKACSKNELLCMTKITVEDILKRLNTYFTKEQTC